jgi:hypothetical protein
MNGTSFFVAFNLYAEISDTGPYILHLKSLCYSVFNFLNALLVAAGNKIVIYIGQDEYYTVRASLTK